MEHSTITGIVMATKIEAAPFLKGLQLSAIEKKPVPIYGNNDIVLVVSGVGKTNAAIGTTHLINNYRPSRIFNLGAAGAAREAFSIGDILHVDEVIEADRPRLLSAKPVTHKPDILKGFTTATLATRDRPALSRNDRTAAGRFADIVDMEASAVVQACRAFGTRVFVFKIISDTAQNTTIEIIKNIRDMRNSLFQFYIEKIVPCI